MFIALFKNYHLASINDYNWSERDRSDVVKFLQEKEIHDTTLSIPFPYSEKDFDVFIKRCKENKNLHSFFIMSEVNGIIGCIEFKIDAIQPHKAILGYWLAKSFWNKGIMTNAVKTLTNIAFKEFGLKKIGASCFENNIGSSKVLEKAGFTQEGLSLHHYKKYDKLHNARLYGKII